MATEFNTQVGNGEYRLQFETNNEAHYLLMQSAARQCVDGIHMTNADRIRSMNDEELPEFLTDINPTNCQDCAFYHGWRCQPDRDDYSSFEKCKEGRKRWLKQPAEEADNETD